MKILSHSWLEERRFYGNMKHTHVQTLIPDEMHRELKMLAITESTTVKNLIKRAIINLLHLKGGTTNGKSKETY